ncbi:hypothetical protein D3C81_1622790 [compost metagenome]
MAAPLGVLSRAGDNPRALHEALIVGSGERHERHEKLGQLGVDAGFGIGRFIVQSDHRDPRANQGAQGVESGSDCLTTDAVQALHQQVGPLGHGPSLNGL